MSVRDMAAPFSNSAVLLPASRSRFSTSCSKGERVDHSPLGVSHHARRKRCASGDACATMKPVFNRSWRKGTSFEMKTPAAPPDSRRRAACTYVSSNCGMPRSKSTKSASVSITTAYL